MNLVNNYEEISSIISSQIKKGVFTNNFLTEDDIKLEIMNNTLYYNSFEGGLFLLRDRNTHYVLNYYINDMNKDVKLDFDKDIVTEIVFRENDRNEEILKFFKSHGMKEYIKRIRLIKVKKVDNISVNKIEMCKEKDCDEVLEILKQGFDKYSGCIPTRRAFLKDIKNENIYICRNEKIEGILRVSKNNLSSEIKHLIVVENARRKKIAQSLVLKYFEDIVSKRNTVWTSIDNKIAINFYEKMGYQKDRYNSIVLLKRKEI